MADEPTLPTYKALLWPCLLSIAEDLHGSGQKSEIVDAVPLCDLLRENGLGVSEQPVVDASFFDEI